MDGVTQIYVFVFAYAKRWFSHDAANQLRCNREADQRLCFRYIASTIPLLPKYNLAIFCSCAARFVSDKVGNQNVGFLTTRLNCSLISSSTELYHCLYGDK